MEGGREIVEALNPIAEMKLDRGAPYFRDWKVFRDLSHVLQFVEFEDDTRPSVAEFQRQHDRHFMPKDRTTKPYARATAPMPRTDPPHNSDAIVW